MKTLLIYLALFLTMTGSTVDTFDGKIKSFNKEWINEVKVISLNNSDQLKTLNKSYVELSNELLSETIIDRCAAIEKKLDIERQFYIYNASVESQFSALRYRKGIELIKMIYEKILGLDHHFTSLKTYQNITELTNPAAYSEFSKAKDLIKERLDKKNDIALPNLLNSNPYVSVTMSLIGSFFGKGDKQERESDLENISCIIDFTLRMNADLNIIYYESEFLKESNNTLREECHKLFKEYTKVVGYFTPLLECRQADDWETLNDKVTETMTMIESSQMGEDLLKKNKAIRKMNDLEFSIDRLLQFLDKYADFVADGELYYGKFKTILNNYGNEKQCTSQLPHQFATLKDDVEISVKKFNQAYAISELQGSKLRDLLYGVPTDNTGM